MLDTPLKLILKPKKLGKGELLGKPASSNVSTGRGMCFPETRMDFLCLKSSISLSDLPLTEPASR